MKSKKPLDIDDLQGQKALKNDRTIVRLGLLLVLLIIILVLIVIYLALVR